MADEPAPIETPKGSDLGVRTLSAIVMVAVAGAAIWFGGIVFALFAVAIGLGVAIEFASLVVKFVDRPFARSIWYAGGLIYIGIAAFALWAVRSGLQGRAAVFAIVATIVAIDIGAYAAGRTFGGPKIAPAISPKKTWAGLFGGIAGAFGVGAVAMAYIHGVPLMAAALDAVVLAPIAAVVAQAGDFFESWMKRRAGVKDSGALIPGHGGLFDRIDGLLALLFVGALVHGAMML